MGGGGDLRKPGARWTRVRRSSIICRNSSPRSVTGSTLTSPQWERDFDALAEAHPLQRLGHGTDLAAVIAEYSALRSIISKNLLELEPSLQLLQATVSR